MSARTSFKAYVISVIDARRICVRIDKEHIDRVLRERAYVSSTVGAQFADTILVNVQNAAFTISRPWSELSDLIGTQIVIGANFRKYNYYKQNKRFRDDGTHTLEMVHCHGVTTIARTISDQ